ncbi:uncharacterized protein NPIL_574971 [Nephila pilipes]|uniref:Uncharacterized protein n=1 Tax=Nephila pilipes TaxID=299642 RepID=A0A8X6QMM4_NEPPI|nr:uncharacterized protein NPIL_574971 [Nephila pilipes]
MRKHAESESGRLRLLSQDSQLLEGAPSSLLRQMKELNCGHVSNDILKTSFLQHLPLAMQQILSVCDDDLDKLTEFADITDETTLNISTASEVSIDPSLLALEAKVEELAKQI